MGEGGGAERDRYTQRDRQIRHKDFREKPNLTIRGKQGTILFSGFWLVFQDYLPSIPSAVS